MTLTKPQIAFLKQLCERPNGEIPLASSPHHPEGWKDLEKAGYITAEPPTPGRPLGPNRSYLPASESLSKRALTYRP